MGNIVGLDLNVDQEYIAASVEKIVKAAIVQALGDQDKIIKKAIDNTIGSYVDRDGKPCQKTSWNAIPFLDYLAEKTVRDTVRECVMELVENNKQEFKDAIMKQLNTRRFKENLAEQFLKVVVEAAGNDWKMPVTVSFQQIRED
jgi:hypothetical protein